MNLNEMIEVVRAAFAPGADDETKRRGAAILHAALNLLEPPPPTTSAVPPMPTTTAPHGSPPDVLAWIIERLRLLVPAEKLKTVPGLHIPMIDFGTDPRLP